jgi:membrane protein DedA with SNARE-associated domain
MSDGSDAILRWLLSIPGWLLYPIAGSAAAIENLIPPFPGDVVVVVTSVIAGATGANIPALFTIVWFANAASALCVYALGRRFGERFFASRIGLYLLAPRQLDALGRAYRRYGLPIIFFSRFLPVFRPIVPAFAGVAGISLAGTAVPIALASGLWYGFLVYLGSTAGQNLPAMTATLDRISGWMWLVAGVFMALVGGWWVLSRRDRTSPPGPSSGTSR